jgi:hypothetical protein
MCQGSIAVSRHNCAAHFSKESVSQLPDLDCLWAGIAMGAPVSNPLRACDRYQAAWLSLKADFGNSVLTTAIISALVTAVFAAKASMAASLMVRFCAAAGFSGFGVFGVATASLPMVCFLVFGCHFTLHPAFTRKKQVLADGAVHAAEEWIFRTDEGTPIYYTNFLRRIWHRVQDLAQIRRRTPHDLRYTWASHMLSGGADLAYVSAQVGHENPSITLRIYSHWVPGTRRITTSILDTKPANNQQNVVEK